MEFKHTSVLLKETIDGLAIKQNGIYVDGTLGGGGHASELCSRLSPEAVFIGIDRDRDALEAAGKRLEKYPCRKHFVQSNYSDIKDVLNELEIEQVDGAMLDLGVSSFQLDNAQRGFSYMNNAPLDMRMNQSDSFTAYDVVNRYSAAELTDVIRKYGEEKWASRIADFIVKFRKDKPVETTAELVEIIKAAIPARARRDGPHPAKRTFQAIRIEVNDELVQLRRACEEFCDVLAPGGRLCIITFHSFEDRIVKECFNRRVNPCTCPPKAPICTCGKKPVVKILAHGAVAPTEEEVARNPRARSAKLRVAQKLEVL